MCLFYYFIVNIASRSQNVRVKLGEELYTLYGAASLPETGTYFSKPAAFSLGWKQAGMRLAGTIPLFRNNKWELNWSANT